MKDFFILLLCSIGIVDSLVFEQRPYFSQDHESSPKFTRQQIRENLGGIPDAHILTPGEKQQYIKDAFVFSWQGYKNYSWGYDENKPVSNTARNTR